MKKFSGEVGIKCHQSCLVALVFCTKLYIKLAVSLCSFSQFAFPFNFRTANALVLKLGTLPLSCLFSNTLLAIFDILFCSTVIYRFVPKNGQKLTCGRVFQHNFISKANLKNPSARFFSSHILLGEETKRIPSARPVFNLKVIEFGAFFTYFHLFRHLKRDTTFPKVCQNILFSTSFQTKKNRLKIAFQVSKLGFSPIVMP